ncbi:hypothetical protein TNCV_2487221 [Trichonephila clavipes]|uniref:Uncharacterized protein n=1 Tax=Trichonephila clavipes TaxID=2585209 RepID=A0A8X6W059_TRICX|nr:hypothetical protein TNCV_2487221 [Trichonephila clavipes]
MVLKAKANDRGKILALSRDEFRGPRPDLVRQVALVTTTIAFTIACSHLQSTDRVRGHGRRVVKVLYRDCPCHELEPSTTKDPPCRGAMHIKSVENSNILSSVWCSS